MLFLRFAAGGAEIVNAKVVGLDARAERGFDVVRQVGELEVCERAAAGADQVISVGGRSCRCVAGIGSGYKSKDNPS